MDAPKARTFRGQLFIWILGGVGAGILAIASLVVGHILSWYDPPDKTDVVLAQNAALIESLKQAMSQRPAASEPQVAVLSPDQAPIVSSMAADPSVSSSETAGDKVALAAPPIASAEAPVSNIAAASPSEVPAMPPAAEESSSSSARPPSSSEVPVALPAPAEVSSSSVRPASSSEVLVAELSEPVRVNDMASSAIVLDALPSATAAPTPAVVFQPQTFGVFEGDKFSVCGHSDFSARLSAGGGKTQIMLSSNDRSIPGRTFRGFERALDPQVPDLFWPGCKVAADFTTVASSTRIIVSILEGEQ